MKKIYYSFRIMLMTFALGLASVFILNGSLEFSDETPVNLPKVKSDSPIIIFSREERFIPDAGGGGSGGKDYVDVKPEQKCKLQK